MKWHHKGALGLAFAYAAFVNVPGGEWVDYGIAGLSYRMTVENAKVTEAGANEAAQELKRHEELLATKRKLEAEYLAIKSMTDFGSQAQEKDEEQADLALGKAIWVSDAEVVLEEIYVTDNLISAQQMGKLAGAIIEKSQGGSATIMSLAEYRSLKQDDAFTELPEAAQKKFASILSPRYGQ